MRYCRECGIPIHYGRFLEWTPEGTIQGRDVDRTHLVFLEVDEVRSHFAGVFERLRTDTDELVFNAEREVGRRFASTIMPKIGSYIPRTRFTRPVFMTRLAGRFIFNYMAGLGMGTARVVSYDTGRGITFAVKDVHSVPLVAGDAAGVFEYVERLGVSVSWEEEASGETVIRLEKVSEHPTGVGRFVLERPPSIPGDVEYEYCDRCGVPREVTANLAWDLASGVIRNRVTGSREVALPAQSFHAVFRELAVEVGPEVTRVLQELEQEYIRESSGIRRYVDEHRELHSLYGDFPWRGMGNPSYAKETGSGAAVVVDNAFHPGMVTGRVAGLYEAWSETRVAASWVEEPPGRLRITLTRSGYGG